MKLTLEQAQQLFHNDKCEEWYKIASEIFPKYEITTKNRIAGFFAQCGHESSDFKTLEENLNYSSKRLNEVFPKYFKNANRDARNYHRQPAKIANVVYANRMGNGDTSSGDGWRYRGRGVIQLTGKNNYSEFAKSIGKTLEETVEYLTTKRGAFEGACWFWKENNVNKACDVNNITWMTKIINGGTHGLQDRRQRYKQALNILKNELAVSFMGVLKRKDRNAQVAKIQRFLGISNDGIFGRGTEAAIKDWQRANGLVADGIVGPVTWAKMFG